MVRLTSVLSRVPVIKFRKGAGGGSGHAQSSPATPAGGVTPTASAAHVQQSSMSSSAIPDINLPARYQRRPLSEEEIAHINGGGIV